MLADAIGGYPGQSVFMHSEFEQALLTWWTDTSRNTDDLVDMALAALANGEDTDALRELAGSPKRAGMGRQLCLLAEQALTDLGVPPIEHATEAFRRVAASHARDLARDPSRRSLEEFVWYARSFADDEVTRELEDLLNYWYLDGDPSQPLLRTQFAVAPAEAARVAAQRWLVAHAPDA